MVLRSLILMLSLAGLATALYFTVAYYGHVHKSRWVRPFFCPDERSNCVTVLSTPYAQVFRLPNSLLGVGYYFLTIAWVCLDTVFAASPSSRPLWFDWLAWGVFGAGCVAVVLGSYLIWALRQRLRVACPLCYLAHGINALLLILMAPRFL